MTLTHEPGKDVPAKEVEFDAEVSHEICRAHTAVRDGLTAWNTAKLNLAEARQRLKVAKAKLEDELGEAEESVKKDSDVARSRKLHLVVKAFSAFRTERDLVGGRAGVTKACKDALRVAQAELYSVIEDAKRGQMRIDFGEGGE